MATPTNKIISKMVEEKILQSIKPIWPNLLKRETRMQYQTEYTFRRDQRFWRSISEHN